LRRLAAFLAVLLAVPALATACSGGSSPAQVSGALPKVAGSFGSAPTITFPSGLPPKALQLRVLQRGNGSTVNKGDVVVVNYVGQIWRGKVFDSSFSRKEPIAVPIGVGDVIPGWDKTLVGGHVGSRLLLVIPPADGYGPKGDAQAGISGTDTIVFVVDLLAVYPKNATAGVPTTPQTLPAGLPEVEGPVGAQPTIVIPKGIKQPTKQRLEVVDLGTGPAVQPGLVILQYEAVDWTGKVLQSTWSTGEPVGEVVGNSAQSGALDSLVGVPIGSRVLILFPAQSDGSGGSTGAYAVVADVIAQAPTS
jgi:peptidylprolyl isomerase